MPPALPPTTASGVTAAVNALSPGLASSVWRGDQLGSTVTSTAPTGWDALDRELPGGGWPCRNLTEVLQPQASIGEWRLFAAVARRLVAARQSVVLVGPPKQPFLPGLRHLGLDDQHLVWVNAKAPAQRLWVTEQLVKSNGCGLLMAWLPQARPEQIRRLQVCAQDCEGLVVLFRHEAAASESSAAPLRVTLGYGLDWELRLGILKRKGPRFEGVLHLPSVPGGLEAVLTRRLRQPSLLLSSRQAPQGANLLCSVHVLGSPSSRPVLHPRSIAA